MNDPTPYGKAEELAHQNERLTQALRRERRALAAERARIQAARELHASDEHGAGCGERDCFPSCLECDEDYPCSTIRALDGTVTPDPQ